MTFTVQQRCVPAKKITEIPPSQGQKSCKTESEELFDDINSLCESLVSLDTALRRLNYLAEKSLAEQNKIHRF